MKLLIAVLTCHRFRNRADVLRRTWVPDATFVDVRFFLGRGGEGTVPSDEVWLDCPDDYPNLRLKTQLAFRWAVDNGYDHVLKTDDDVYVISPRLQAYFTGHDYTGRVRGPSGTYSSDYEGRPLPTGMKLYGDKEASFASGFGYWLSARAARVVADAPDNGDWAEDRFTGNVLARAGFRPVHNERFLLWPPLWGHFCTRPNAGCTLCRLQYAQAEIICPYAKPHVLEELHGWYKRSGFFPTNL